MMANHFTSVLVGLLAGLAAALLLLSAGTPSQVSVFLFAAAALPVIIAGLGWSNIASSVAVGAAFLLVALLANPLAALMTAATTLVPAAWISHLANLARPAEEMGGAPGQLAWYPLPGILLHICGLVCLGLLVMGYVVGYGPDLASQMVDLLVETMRSQNPAYQPSAEGTAQMKIFFTHALPAVQGALWVAILFTALYAGLEVVRLSGRLKRPRDDLPATLRLPRASVIAFAAGLGLTFLGGVPVLIGYAVVGAFAMGFIMAGFAIVHERTRGKPWRGLALWLSYMSVIFITLPLFVFLFLGLADTAKRGQPGPNASTP